MGLIASLIVLFILLTIVAIVVGAAAVACFSYVAARFLERSRHEWMIHYITTIPSFVATFTILYVPLSLYGLVQSWMFPEHLLDFFIGLLTGQCFSAAAGWAWATRIHHRKRQGREFEFE